MREAIAGFRHKATLDIVTPDPMLCHQDLVISQECSILCYCFVDDDRRVFVPLILCFFFP